MSFFINFVFLHRVNNFVFHRLTMAITKELTEAHQASEGAYLEHGVAQHNNSTGPKV